VAVVDPDGRVQGIFTDGDLRRHLDDPGGLSDRAVTEVMTPDPVAIGVDQLAAEALRVFERHKIDDLVVVDAQGRLAGMIDLQDLPRMKLL
jgi:arabinose-5-phosphate isomerase